jgi:ABC-type branched-subunit amino acid transport system substrate-binding protein
MRTLSYTVSPILLIPLLMGVQTLVPVFAGALTPQERRGQQIYLQGTSPAGGELTAVLSREGAEVPASVLPCANCHGHDGRGKPEGGLVPSNITWEVLTTPYGLTHATGRTHPPYTEHLLQGAITMGIDPAGNPLHPAMPRYRLSHQDLSDLMAYLKQVGKSLDPGVTETTIQVGTMLPPTGGLADVSHAVRAVLTAYFDVINQRGGIYNRRLDVRFAVSPDVPTARAPAMRAFLNEERIFALTGSYMAGAEADIAALLAEEAIPLVGAFALDPQVGFPLNRYVFYLAAGLSDQGRALAAFAAKRYARQNPRTAIIHPNAKSAREVAEAIHKQCQQSGWNVIEEIGVPQDQFSPALLAQQLSASGTEIVFFLGPSAAARALFQEARTRDWQPIFLLPGALAGRELFEAPTSLDGRIWVSFSQLPGDYTPKGMEEYRSLAQAYGLSPQPLEAQLTALASAKILVEGFIRAGRNVSREKLIEALEGLYDFQTGFTPRLTYGPNRRVGTLGAYVMAVDLGEQRLVPISTWIDLR